MLLLKKAEWNHHGRFQAVRKLIEPLQKNPDKHTRAFIHDHRVKSIL